MKRISPLAIILSFLIASCSKDNHEIIAPQTDLQCEYVNAALSARHRLFAKTKSVDDISSLFPIISGIDTIAVIANFGNNDGFAVVASDLTKSALLACDHGHYDGFTSGCEDLDILIEEVAASFRDSSTFRPDSDFILEEVIDTITNTLSKAPMIPVLWGQGQPFNWLTSNGLAGCTPIAIAQVMAYYKLPESIGISFPDADITNLSIDWDNLAISETHYDRSCTFCWQKAYLLRQIGHICHASYYTTGTGAWPYLRYLNTLGYQGNDYSSFNFQSIYTSLRNDKPCIIVGFDDSREPTVGHTWIIDGFIMNEEDIISISRHSTGLLQMETLKKYKDYYLHFNLGWNGSSNAFVLSQREIYTTDSESGIVSLETPVTIFSTPSYTRVPYLVCDVEPINQ